MPIAMDFDLDEHISAGDLSNGWIVAQINDAEETKYGSLMLKTEILEGPEDQNGKPVEGRQEVFFITTDFSRVDPQYHDFLKDIVKNVFVACGLNASAEAGDFVGETLRLRIKSKVDNEGNNRTNVQDAKVYSG